MNPALQLRIHIDDRPLQVDHGLMILEAARRNGIEIPTLCDFPGLPSRGSCRMCIVEIQGRPNTPTACTTPVEEGMVIFTHSPKVMALRAELLQLLLAEHPSGCVFCPENGHCDECMLTLRKAGVTTGCGSCPKDSQCELQALAAKYGVEEPVFPIHYRMLPVEKHDPFFDRDDNLCILCGRCIRACEDLHFVSTLAHTQRGTHALVGTAFHRTHLESSCTFCGTCVEVCPTGALSEKTRKWAGKPERETATTCPLCSIGCQMNLLSKGERVIGSLPNRQAGTRLLCVKGRFGITELVNPSARLNHPQQRVGNFRQKIGWEAAVQVAAKKLAACSPEHFELHISASSTNEDLYAAYRFARDVMKTSRIRISSGGVVGKDLNSLTRLIQRSQPLEILEEGPAVLCVGLEDPYTGSVVESRLHRARSRGAKIILLGSRRLAWSGYADEWLRSENGQEKGVIESLIEALGTSPTALMESNPIFRAARLMHQSESPVILIGPAVLARQDSQALIAAVEALSIQLSARVVVLPDFANLNGALRLDLGSETPASERQEVDVLYLIGEAVPEALPGSPFIIFQNLYPLAAEAAAYLLLPTTAFSEERGTFTNYAGQVQAVHPAVQPPGEALPSWMILSRIAQQMGVQGFDFTCVEDLWQAAQLDFPGFPDIPLLKAPGLVSENKLARLAEEPFYMGFPLSQRVEGMCSLYPESMDRGRS